MSELERLLSGEDQAQKFQVDKGAMKSCAGYEAMVVKHFRDAIQDGWNLAIQYCVSIEDLNHLKTLLNKP